MRKTPCIQHFKKNTPPIILNCENPILLVTAMNNQHDFQNSYCGHFTKISSFYHNQQIEKRRPDLLRPPIMPNVRNITNSTSVSAQTNPQGNQCRPLNYYHRPVHRVHSNHLPRPHGFRSSLVWNCSMTSQKYRVVCLSAVIILYQIDKI